MTKTTYQHPITIPINIYVEEDITQGNLLINSHETNQEQLGKEIEIDVDDSLFSFEDSNNE